MAYIVNKYNGVPIATVQDGTTDGTTDLTFIGKNYPGYGEVQNENFLHLLENFANPTGSPPTRPIEGQLWYDSTTKTLKFYNGMRFKSGAVEYGPTIPTNPSLGDLWWDSALNKLYSYAGTTVGERSGFHLVGPDNNTSHTSVQARTIADTTGADSLHDIVELIAHDVVVAIFNSDPEFSVIETDPIDLTDPFAFRTIKQGITLRYTGIDGVSHSDIKPWQFWGTASDARKLNGYDADAFAKLIGDTFTGLVKFDAGIELKTLKVNGDGSNNIVFTNGNPFKFVVDDATSLVISKTNLTPMVTATIDLGTTVLKWKDIWATGSITAGSFTGNIKDSTGVVLLDNTLKTFTGSIKDSTGSSVLLDNALKTFKGNVLDSSGVTIVNNTSKEFTGNLIGQANTAKSLVPPTTEVVGTTTNYPPAITALAYTTVIRTADGKILSAGISGNSDGSDMLKVYDTDTSLTGTNRKATVSSTNYTVAARNATGQLNATQFNGLATSAYYADLAEKYLTDVEYAVGTVVVVGGDSEVTACSVGGFVIGVVSDTPAYMMNSGLVGGTYIALKGRVPTKVTGSVVKGDRLIAAADGCATANNSTTNHVFGIALESSSAISAKLIEVLVL
jgi:hypothetical protein